MQTYSKYFIEEPSIDGMETAPIHQLNNPALKTGVAVVQTVAVLLENGPAFSVLFADHISYEPDDGGVCLEDCTQFRIEPDNRRYIRKFPLVSIYRDKMMPYFLASPDGGDTVFSQPSQDRYAVVELSHEDAKEVYAALKRIDHDTVFEMLRDRYGNLPGFFSPDSDELRAPDTYACAGDQYPGNGYFL